ncbi:MAG: hypothetical protein ACREGL_04465 [Alphaproteobacteria bacterium]
MSRTESLQSGGSVSGLLDRGLLAVSPGEVGVPAPVKFTFLFYGLQFQATVEKAGENARLRLLAELGPLPFSYQSAVARRSLCQILRSSEEGSRARFRLGPAQAMRVEAETPLSLPLSPVMLVASTTVLLVDAKPYLKMIADALPGDHRPAAAAPKAQLTGGTVNI